METLTTSLDLCEGDQPVTINSHHIGLLMGRFDILLLTWTSCWTKEVQLEVDGFMQERRNSIANTLELRLSCTNQSD